MHHAIAFAFASEFCRKLPFARNFRSEDEIFAISFAKPFTFASEFLRNAKFAASFFEIWWLKFASEFSGRVRIRIRIRSRIAATAVHSGGYPLSRYTCRATRVATDFLDFIAFCRCSTGVALSHPLKVLVSHLPPPVPGGVAPKFGCLKRCRATRGCR